MIFDLLKLKGKIMNDGFNLVKLKLGLKDNNFTVLDVVKSFKNKDLIHNTIYKANAGGKFEAWKEVSTILDALLIKSIPYFDYTDKGWIEFINGSVFFPSSLDSCSAETIIYYLNSLDLFYLNTFFCIKRNVERFKDIMGDRNVLIQIKELVFFQFLLASCKEELLNVKEEIALIESYLSRHNVSDILKTVLQKRLGSLVSINSMRDHTIPVTSYHVLIGGQFRGGDMTLPIILKKIRNSKGIASIAISSWSQKGAPRFIPQLYGRIFENDAIDLFKSSISDTLIQKVASSLKDSDVLEKKDLDELIKKADINNISVNKFVFDQRDYPYSAMGNAEKMYFHNTFLFSKLMKVERETVVLKLRPDTLFKTEVGFNIVELDYNNKIYAESKYRFAPWGFGMGDQIILGLSKNLKSILCCHMRSSLSYKILKEVYKHSTGYQGHVNVGLEAWLQGLIIKNLPKEFSQIGLNSTKKITKDQLMQWI